MNLFDSVTYYPVHVDDIKNIELKNYLISEYFISEEDLDTDKILSLSKAEMDSLEEEFGYDSFGSSIDYVIPDFMEDELEDILYNYLGNHSYYLVFADGVRWNGASGYKICSNILDTVYRDYDFDLTITDYKEGQYIAGLESSHDRPTECRYCIIGISSEEQEYLEDCEFNEVEEFVVNKIK